jgi:hypothetical protein
MGSGPAGRGGSGPRDPCLPVGGQQAADQRQEQPADSRQNPAERSRDEGPLAGDRHGIGLEPPPGQLPTRECRTLSMAAMITFADPSIALATALAGLRSWLAIWAWERPARICGLYCAPARM